MKAASLSWIRRFLRRGALVLGILFVVVFAVVAYTNLAATRSAEGRLFHEAAEIPVHRVGLIFGCDDQIDGRENLYFRYRIEAALRLWNAGKVSCFLVSGDNRTKYYNEPEAMRQALVERGVPADRIVEDFAGLRTLDSVVRAKEIFGVTDVIFVSQRFQNERAIYIARANGIDAVGFNAQDVVGSGGYKTKLREVGARVQMWLDVNVLSTRPKVMGPAEALPGND
jgi:SanA protein